MQRPFADPSILDDAYKETMAIPDATMADLLFRAASAKPDRPAVRFMGATLTYHALTERVRQCEDALRALGVREGSVVSICLPNIPEAVFLFYAVNHLNAICDMVHPLAPAAAIAEHVKQSGSSILFLSDLFLDRLAKPLDDAFDTTPLKQIVVIPAMTSAAFPIRWGYRLTKGRGARRHLPGNARWTLWDAVMRGASDRGARAEEDTPAATENDVTRADRVSVYLHSGGTTGRSKIIELSDRNFNAIACQIMSAVGLPTDGSYPEKLLSMVTVLPLFHGFGLCIGMHSMLANACCCILVPRFSPKDVASVIKKYRPSVMAGVPTLYEALLNAKEMEESDLSSFLAFFCGGDALPPDLKKHFDLFLKNHHSDCRLREGYGLTETVTVCCLSHEVSADRSGIGVPLTNIEMKIIDPETRETLPDGETGEICVTGPQTMKGYLNDPEATAQTLVRHDDGKIWVETGDLGYRERDGFYHFRGRIKRMIKVSGIPVYPGEVEALIAELPDVLQVAVIGVPHPYKMQVVKAFVRAREGCDRDALREEIKTVVARRLLRYAVPKEIAFVDRFPLTQVGKIDTLALEAQEREKRQNN